MEGIAGDSNCCHCVVIVVVVVAVVVIAVVVVRKWSSGILRWHEINASVLVASLGI